MKYYLKRVIPIINHLKDEDWEMLLRQIKPFIKEIQPQEESFSGTLVLTDSPEGVALAREAGLPCLGIESVPADSGEEAAEREAEERTTERLSCPYVATDISAVTLECMERVYRRFYDIPWEIFESERCIIREGTEEDAEQILKIYEDIEDFALTRPFASVEEGRRYIRDYRDMVYRLYEYGLWVVEEKKSGKLIGEAGLENQSFGEQEYLALGYVIGKAWRRKGYGEEIGRAILHYGKEELGLEALHCFVEPENTGSLRLVEKLGFCQKEMLLSEGKNGGTESGQQTRLCHYVWKNPEG